MPTQLNIFLLLFGGLQGLLFSLFLFRKKLQMSGYIFLLFYLATMLLQITLKVMNKLVLLRPLGNVVYIMPPYCITKEELYKIYSVITNSLSYLKKITT